MLSFLRARKVTFDSGVQAFYLNSFLRNLYMGMTVIFTPIFLYELAIARYGTVRSALLVIMVFYILQRAIITGILFPVSRVVEKIGFRRSVLLSIIFLILYNLGLVLAKQNFWWLIPADIIIGFNTTFYWLARDSVLSQDSSKDRMGRNISTLSIWENVGAMIGPFFAGLIVSVYGYLTMYVISAIVLVVSVIPLMAMPHHTHRNGVSWRGFLLWLKDKRYSHSGIANFAVAINDYSLTILWPMVLYFKGIHEKALGGLFSAVAFIMMGLQFASGRIFDKLRKRRDWADEAVFGIAAVALSGAWVVRMAVTTLFQVVAVDLTAGLFSTVYAGFYSDYMHLGGKRMGSIAYWVYMEMLYSLGAIAVFTLAALGVWYGVWKELFMLTAAMWIAVSIVAARESNL